MPALLASTTSDVWQFQAHPEVWLLVAFLVGAYVYMVKVIGPRAVRGDEPIVRRRQIVAFAVAMVLLWVFSDWPVHDLGEQHLYSVHMLQHMVLSYFVPPLALVATPEWMARTLVGTGRTYRVVRFLAKPVVAGVIFNAVVMITHIPGVVNESVTGAAPIHYSLHVLLVTTALLMWMPVCGPLPELRIGPGAQMIYLFAMSIVPTVPAGWLTFADGIVYKAYDHGPVVAGLDPTQDQQLAGVIMKIGGSMFLWTVVTIMFFGRFMAKWEEQQTFSRKRRIPDAEITGHGDEEPLLYAHVQRVFETVPPPEEPAKPTP